MGLDHTDYLNFFNLVELMTKMGYIVEFNDIEKCLLNILWQNLAIEIRGQNDTGITQRNLVIFL